VKLALELQLLGFQLLATQVLRDEAFEALGARGERRPVGADLVSDSSCLLDRKGPHPTPDRVISERDEWVSIEHARFAVVLGDLVERPEVDQIIVKSARCHAVGGEQVPLER
jgi:hypothetical protein